MIHSRARIIRGFVECRQRSLQQRRKAPGRGLWSLNTTPDGSRQVFEAESFRLALLLQHHAKHTVSVISTNYS